MQTNDMTFLEKLAAQPLYVNLAGKAYINHTKMPTFGAKQFKEAKAVADFLDKHNTQFSLAVNSSGMAFCSGPHFPEKGYLSTRLTVIVDGKITRFDNGNKVEQYPEGEADITATIFPDTETIILGDGDDAYSNAIDLPGVPLSDDAIAFFAGLGYEWDPVQNEVSKVDTEDQGINFKLKKIDLNLEGEVNPILLDEQIFQKLHKSATLSPSDILFPPSDSPADDEEPLMLSGNDPIKNQQKLMSSTIKPRRLVPEQVARSNRTLVVVHLDSGVQDDNYKERVARFIGGLNLANTIKAVIITIKGGHIYDGLVLNAPDNDDPLDEDGLAELRSKYVQVIDVRNERTYG